MDSILHFDLIIDVVNYFLIVFFCMSIEIFSDFQIMKKRNKEQDKRQKAVSFIRDDGKEEDKDEKENNHKRGDESQWGFFFMTVLFKERYLSFQFACC